MTHLGATLNDNNTVSGGNITHVGQFFFDQALITEVEKESPYTANEQVLTTNEEDYIFAEEAANVDAVVEYVYLGDTPAKGLFGWIAFGIDATAARDVHAAVNYGENGGVPNSNGCAPGGPRPTGARPTNFPTAPPSAA